MCFYRLLNRRDFERFVVRCHRFFFRKYVFIDFFRLIDRCVRVDRLLFQ